MRRPLAVNYGVADGGGGRGGWSTLAGRVAVVAGVGVAVGTPWLRLGSGGFCIAAAANAAVVGVGMRWAVRARRRAVALSAVAVAVVITVAGLYAAEYLILATDVNVATSGHRLPPGRPWYELTTGFDQLRQQVRSGGLGGGATTQWDHVAGWWAGVMGVTAIVGWSMARRALTDPACPACTAPLPRPVRVTAVALGAIVPLVAAVEADDAGRVRAAVSPAADPGECGAGERGAGERGAVARSYRCSACGRRAVDVVAVVPGGRTSISLMGVTGVSDAVDGAVRGEPVAATGPRLAVG